MWTRRHWLTAGAAWLGGSQVWAAGTRDAWDAGRLAAAGRIANGNWPVGWAAWQGGARIADFKRRAVAPALSITKAITGLAVARAVQDGWLRLTEPAAQTLVEWQRDPGKSAITVRMLLQMTSGLEDGAGALYRQGIDKGRVALGLRLIDRPGTQFRYGPSHWEALGELLQRKLAARGSSLEAHLRSAVMSPLGLSTREWRRDGRRRVYLSTGTHLHAEHLGRLGRAIAALRRGESVHGIDARAYAQVTQPSSANPMFGGGLWQNKRAVPAGHAIEVEDALDPARPPAFWSFACLSRQQPNDFVALIGSSGKRVFIWPREDRVFARLGAARSWKDWPLLEVL